MSSSFIFTHDMNESNAGPVNSANYYTHSRTFLTPTRPRPHNMGERVLGKRKKKIREKTASASGIQTVGRGGGLAPNCFLSYELWLCARQWNVDCQHTKERERKRTGVTCQGWWGFFCQGRCEKWWNELKIGISRFDGQLLFSLVYSRDMSKHIQYRSRQNNQT